MLKGKSGIIMPLISRKKQEPCLVFKHNNVLAVINQAFNFNFREEENTRMDVGTANVVMVSYVLPRHIRYTEVIFYYITIWVKNELHALM